MSGTASGAYKWSSGKAGFPYTFPIIFGRKGAQGESPSPHGSSSGTYTFAKTATGRRLPKGTVAKTYRWAGSASGYRGSSTGVKQGTASSTWNFRFGGAVGYSRTYPMYSTASYYDSRFRFVVEDVHGNILLRDVVPQGEVQIIRMLSAPAQIEFKIHYNEPSVQIPNGIGPLQFKPWGHWIHAIKEDQFGNDVIWASGLVQPSEIDPDSGVLNLKAEGFSNYAKGIPWLENWNPIAVDPFEIVERIWNHIQSFPNANLNVTTYPTSSGTQMLPGFSFENEQFVQNFFAIFIREVDRTDCGDYINKLARDIPFDYFEESVWNEAKTGIDKKIRLAYPKGGVDQTDLIFRVNENVSSAKQKGEVEMSWVSGFTFKGWFPQKEYYGDFINADPNRYRRVIDEMDLRLDSNERSAAWAHRKLTRRQIPLYYDSITIDPYHSNAPFGTFDVGDFIRTQGPMAWHGVIDQKHKIMAMGWDESKGTMELKLMAEGAFNYDPIEYVK